MPRPLVGRCTLFAAKVEPADNTPVRRAWRAASGGFEVEAELIDDNDDQVKLKRTDGRIVTVQVDQLIEPDQQFLLKLK